MRKLLFFGLSVLYALAMTFCAYTPVVTNYINDESNYIEIQAKFEGAEYHDEGYSYLYIRLMDFYRYRGFTGKNPESYDESILENTVITIKIMPENAKILLERNFFDGFDDDTTISIHTTCWIYEGAERHFLASVRTAYTEYLTFEEGMHGINLASAQFKDIEIEEILKNYFKKK